MIGWAKRSRTRYSIPMSPEEARRDNIASIIVIIVLGCLIIGLYLFGPRCQMSHQTEGWCYESSPNGGDKYKCIITMCDKYQQ